MALVALLRRSLVLAPMSEAAAAAAAAAVAAAGRGAAGKPSGWRIEPKRKGALGAATADSDGAGTVVGAAVSSVGEIVCAVTPCAGAVVAGAM